MTQPTQFLLSELRSPAKPQSLTHVAGPKVRRMGWTKSTAVSPKKPFTIIPSGHTHTFPKGTAIEILDEDHDVFTLHAHAKTQVTGPAIVRTRKISKKVPSFLARMWEPLENLPRLMLGGAAGGAILLHVGTILNPEIADALFLFYFVGACFSCLGITHAADSKPQPYEKTLAAPPLPHTTQEASIPQTEASPAP